MTTTISAPDLCDTCRHELERQTSPYRMHYCEHHQALAVAILTEGRLAGYRTFGPLTADEAAAVIEQGIQQGVDRYQSERSTKQ